MLKRIKASLRSIFERVTKYLSTLSHRTGVIVLVMCIPFYIISFAQMLLPISTSAKAVLWFIFFGLAKTAQYSGLTILGAVSIKNYLSRRRQNRQQSSKENI